MESNLLLELMRLGWRPVGAVAAICRREVRG